MSAEQGLTPLVGRQRDLEFLINTFRRAQRGSGQAVIISSEAGMGKSRLLYEFRKAIANEPVFFFEGKCLSYSSKRSLSSRYRYPQVLLSGERWRGRRGCPG